MSIPVISIVGKSGTGKTTLLEKLIAELRQRNYKIATIKHDVHGFDIDHEGKDSYRHKHAGACQTIISSPRQMAMVKDTEKDHHIDEIVELYIKDVDLVLTEGYKRNNKLKIEVHRKDAHRDLLCDESDDVLAVATDEKLTVQFPQYNIDDAVGLCDLIESKVLQVKR